MLHLPQQHRTPCWKSKMTMKKLQNWYQNRLHIDHGFFDAQWFGIPCQLQGLYDGVRFCALFAIVGLMTNDSYIALIYNANTLTLCSLTKKARLSTIIFLYLSGCNSFFQSNIVAVKTPTGLSMIGLIT